MELDVHADALLAKAHTVAIFRDADVLPTAEAIAALANDHHVRVYALAEALQYHLGDAPDYRYRALVQTLAAFDNDDRPPPLLDRLRQVMHAVEVRAQVPQQT